MCRGTTNRSFTSNINKSYIIFIHLGWESEDCDILSKVSRNVT